MCELRIHKHVFQCKFDLIGFGFNYLSLFAHYYCIKDDFNNGISGLEICTAKLHDVK